MTTAPVGGRPWDYEVQGRVVLTDEQLEMVADRFTPSRVSLHYRADDNHLTLRGYTGSTEPWETIGWLLSALRGALPDAPFELELAAIRRGESDTEVRAYLADAGLPDDPDLAEWAELEGRGGG